MLSLITFVAMILGPLAFFMALDVRPRLRRLEERDDSRSALERRLTDLERKAAFTSTPETAPAPAAARPTGTAAPAAPMRRADEAKPPPSTVPPLTVAADTFSASPPDATLVSPRTPDRETTTPATVSPATPSEPVAQVVPEPAQTDERRESEPTADTAEAESGGALPPDPIADGAPHKPAMGAIAGGSFEERIGTRWTVWVGGLALALGAILLVRYSIERGFFGPGVRVALGFVLAAALIAAGEFLRRRDEIPAAAQGPYIPGMLTATGTIAAFGTVYAAYALYHFIGPSAAFLALGVTGIACMAAALLHGPALAGLGLAGSLVTPLLISTAQPSAWPVVIYVGIVSAVAHELARRQGWLWLSLAAAAGGVAWAILLLDGIPLGFFAAAMTHIPLQAAFAAFFLVFQRLHAVPEEDSKPDFIGNVVLAAVSVLTIAALYVGSITDNFGGVWLAGGAAVTAILALTALRVPATASAIAGAGLLVLAAMIFWPPLPEGHVVSSLVLAIIDLLRPDEMAWFTVVALLGSLAIAVLAAERLYRGARLLFVAAACYAGAAALTPIGALGIAYLRLSQGEASYPLTAIAVAGALAFAAGAWAFLRKQATEPKQSILLGLGALASAAATAIALALVFALEGGLLTVALALAAAGTAFVSVRFGVDALRWCVAGFGILVAARLAWDPRIVGPDLSPTPIFNWLLFGYGVPAVSFGLAGRLLRSRADDVPTRVADALAVLFSAFLVFFEIRHAMNGGDPYARTSGLVEQGLLAVSSFAFGIVLTRLDAARANIVFRFASLAAGAIGFAVAAVGLGIRWNPLLARAPVEGGPVLNALALGYLLPGVLAGVLALATRHSRPVWYWAGAGVFALAFGLAFLLLETRMLFHGPVISIDRGASLSELGIDTAICLIAATGLAAALIRSDAIFWRYALIAVAALAAVFCVIGTLLAHNPLLRPDPVAGGAILNALILGYLLPAAMAAILAHVAYALRPEIFWQSAAAATLALGLVYVSLEVRVLFHGPVISIDRGASLSELGIDTAICLGAAIGLAAALSRSDAIFWRYALVAVAALAAVFCVVGTLLAHNPFLRLDPVAGGPILNTLILGYLLPAAMAAVLARVAYPLRPEIFWQSAAAAAFALGLVCLSLEVRVLFHGASIAASRGAGIAELGVLAAMYLAIATLLMQAAEMLRSRLVSLAAMATSALAFAVGLFGLAFKANPLWSAELIGGGVFLNTLLVGYALPAVLAFVLARRVNRAGDVPIPAGFRHSASIAAIAWLFAFVSLETRRIFQGDDLWYLRLTSEGEWYAYSAVWLVLGVVLLGYGLWRRSTTVRLASAVFVFASVVKVFLFDLAGLEGILRAASFIGLGLALIGIGLTYQKLVFSRQHAAA